jgi:purine-binding chemotaxis protein CheW
VLGIINLRGQILSVIDFGRYVGLPVKGITELNRLVVVRSATLEFGFLADEILGMRTIPRQALREPSFQLGVVSQFVLGLAPDGLIVLDGGRMLADRTLIVEEDIS